MDYDPTEKRNVWGDDVPQNRSENQNREGPSRTTTVNSFLVDVESSVWTNPQQENSIRGPKDTRLHMEFLRAPF